MDPYHIITAALTAGALAIKDTAETALQDAYIALKSLILSKFNNRGDAVKALEAVEAKPASESRKGVLREELEAAGAGKDQEVVDRATDLLKLIENKIPGATGGLVGQINLSGGKVIVMNTNYGPINM